MTVIAFNALPWSYFREKCVTFACKNWSLVAFKQRSAIK